MLFIDGTGDHNVRHSKPDPEKQTLACFLSFRSKEKNGHEHKWVLVGGLQEMGI
jgi:hypothetical protein